LPNRSRLPVQFSLFLFHFVAALIELGEPVAPRQQIPVRFGLHVVAEPGPEHLIIPDVHVGEQLLHLAVQEVAGEPVGQEVRGVDLVRHLELEAAHGRHRLAEGRLKVAELEEEIDQRRPALEPRQVEDKETHAEHPQVAVQVNDVQVLLVLFGDVFAEHAHLEVVEEGFFMLHLV